MLQAYWILLRTVYLRDQLASVFTPQSYDITTFGIITSRLFLEPIIGFVQTHNTHWQIINCETFHERYTPAKLFERNLHVPRFAPDPLTFMS